MDALMSRKEGADRKNENEVKSWKDLNRVTEKLELFNNGRKVLCPNN